MAHFKDAVEAFVASREWDQASLSRLAFWVDVLGEKEIAAIMSSLRQTGNQCMSATENLL